MRACVCVCACENVAVAVVMVTMMMVVVLTLKAKIIVVAYQYMVLWGKERNRGNITRRTLPTSSVAVPLEEMRHPPPGTTQVCCATGRTPATWPSITWI